jgi:hypothetical protein
LKHYKVKNGMLKKISMFLVASYFFGSGVAHADEKVCCGNVLNSNCWKPIRSLFGQVEGKRIDRNIRVWTAIWLTKKSCDDDSQHWQRINVDQAACQAIAEHARQELDKFAQQCKANGGEAGKPSEPMFTNYRPTVYPNVPTEN